MTRVIFYADAGGRLTGFDASGHAGYAEAGKDIVCAAISALTQAAVGGLEQVVNAPLEVTRDDERGRLKALIAPAAPDGALRDAQIILETLKMALNAISGEYPGMIQISIRERR